MTRTLISTGSDFEKTGGYSRALVQETPAGKWVFVSGTTGMNYETNTMPETVEEQTRNCLETIKKALEEAGCSMEDVVRSHYYITEQSDWKKVFLVLGEYFGDIRPAATMVVSGLIDPSMKIEIEVTALK